MKIYDIEKLDPKDVTKWFKAISKIPHGTYHEEAISKFLAESCKEAGAEVIRYKSGMVLAKLPATKGYEEAPVTLLQSHMDMVLAKTAECKKDLLKDPITVYYDTETGYVRGEETSLGADDGLGVAMMLAIAHDKNLKHGKLELIFSTAEEDNPGVCINDMKPDDIESTYYINLDGDHIDSLVYGGAGTVTVKYSENVSYVKRPAGYVSVKIELSGFMGGHSGIHIDKPHINAITFLSETLTNFADEFKTKIGLFNIYGGPVNNSIPLIARAEIQIEKERVDDLETYFNNALALAKTIAQGNEEKVKLNISRMNEQTKMMPFDLSRRILLIGDLCPNKVFTEALDRKTMYSSSNLGYMVIEHDKLQWDFKVRSFVDAEAYRTTKQIIKLMSLIGFDNWYYQGALSAFINDITNNKVAILWEEMHKQVTGRVLGKSASAGALESASFCKVNPIMTENTIIVNATVLYEHSTKEAFVLKDLQAFWKILKLVLENIK